MASFSLFSVQLQPPVMAAGRQAGTCLVQIDIAPLAFQPKNTLTQILLPRQSKCQKMRPAQSHVDQGPNTQAADIHSRNHHHANTDTNRL